MIPFNVDHVIYFFMFICAALLLFNIVYILSSDSKKKSLERQTKFWEGVADEVIPFCAEHGKLPEQHQSLLEKKLKNINQLIAFNKAMQPRIGKEETQCYLDLTHAAFQKLAAVYAERSAMEKAFFAYSISVYHPVSGKERDRLVEILLTYVNNSTIFCRENVLQALCGMGNYGAIENFFALLNTAGYYHNVRLLSDGLMTFRGDRELLAKRLFQKRREYREDLQVAIVQFATQLSDSFAEMFFRALQDEATLPEVRFALIRYFQRYRYENAREFLFACVREKQALGDELAIPACAALARYPGADTEAVLKEALRSRNWYVRKNAAFSIAALGIEQETLRELQDSNDRYASEMLQYIIELKSGESKSGKEAK